MSNEVVVGVRRPGGRSKKGRKIGKGVRKLARSHWGTYAALIAAQKRRRAERVQRRSEKFALRRLLKQE